MSRNRLLRSRIQRSLDYIEENIDHPIRLNDLAKAASFSVYHFQRSFRKTIGITPTRYLWRRRVECAKRLLKEPKALALCFIAYVCGFSSQSHFTTIFKREVGVTPGKFRAKL